MELAVAVHVVGADDVGAAEPGDSLGLAVEALDGAGVFRLGGRQHLDGNRPVHNVVGTQVHRPHAAGAERFEDGVLAAEDEVAPAAAEQLIGLKAGQQSLADEGVAIWFGVAGASSPRRARQSSRRFGFDHGALAHALQEVANDCRRRHRLLGGSDGGGMDSDGCETGLALPPFWHARGRMARRAVRVRPGSPSPPYSGERGWGEGVWFPRQNPSPPTPLP